MYTWVNEYKNHCLQMAETLPYEGMESLVGVLLKAKSRGSRVYIIGNGGSAALAEHFSQDLRKQCGLRSTALTNISEVTAVANDIEYRWSFGDQLLTLLDVKDVLIVISGSGNSPNVIKAAQVAQRKDAIVVGLTGFEGGVLRKENLLDLELNVPFASMAQAENGHMLIMHGVVYNIMDKIKAANQEDPR